MSRSLFIAGITSHLHDAFIAELKKDPENYIIATNTEGDDIATEDSEESTFHYLPWTAHSPISARTVITRIENSPTLIDEAIVTIYTAPLSKAFHEASWTTIDQLIDNAIKSTLFIFREIINLFHRNGRGTLTIAWQIPEISSVTAFGKILFPTIRSIVDTLLEIYESYPINIKAFYTYDDETENFVKYVLENQRKEKYQKKWIRYSGDRSPLSIFKQ